MTARNVLIARFWDKVAGADPGGCWQWTGAVDHASGYGRFANPGSSLAHRFAYEHMVSRIPAGLQLDHLCRNRACVNPYHLDPVTPRVNSLRSPIAPTALNALKTCCSRGHAFDVRNTYRYNGRRLCRTCRRDNARARRAVAA